jgi:hypothetical protein
MEPCGIPALAATRDQHVLAFESFHTVIPPATAKVEMDTLRRTNLFTFEADSSGGIYASDEKATRNVSNNTPNLRDN